MTPRVLDVRPEELAAATAALQRLALAPVSYTHLTLPTILRV